MCLAGHLQPGRPLPAALQVSPAAAGAATLHWNACRSPAHCIEYAKLILWEHERPGDTFDADEEEHMKWVFDRASTRAQEFGIQVGLAAVLMLCTHTYVTGSAAATQVLLHPHRVGDPSRLGFQHAASSELPCPPGRRACSARNCCSVHLWTMCGAWPVAARTLK